MSLVPIEYVELHEPFFLAGTNMPSKLPDPTKSLLDMAMSYDHESDWLHIGFTDKTGVHKVGKIPKTNIKLMVEMSEEKASQRAAAKAQLPKINPKPVSAQVSSPQGHVFAGPGAGKR